MKRRRFGRHLHWEKKVREARNEWKWIFPLKMVNFPFIVDFPIKNGSIAETVRDSNDVLTEHVLTIATWHEIDCMI